MLTVEPVKPKTRTQVHRFVLVADTLCIRPRIGYAACFLLFSAYQIAVAAAFEAFKDRLQIDLGVN